MVPPAPTARVNDYAGVLAAGDRTRLEALLAERERATGAQMVLAIFRSLEGENLEDFGIRLAERWRIGQRGLDNGVILLVFFDDRRMRLEVGYGLEPVLPDAVARTIISGVIAPRFREGRHAAGLEAAVNEVYARVARPGVAPPARSTPPENSWLDFVGFGVVLVVIGAVALVIVSKIASELLGQHPVRRVRRGRRGYTAGPDGWEIGPGSWGSWSGGGGGGGDGGSFSGGGGDFGGGGASGEW